MSGCSLILLLQRLSFSYSLAACKKYLLIWPWPVLIAEQRARSFIACSDSMINRKVNINRHHLTDKYICCIAIYYVQLREKQVADHQLVLFPVCKKTCTMFLWFVLKCIIVPEGDWSFFEIFLEQRRHFALRFLLSILNIVSEMIQFTY